MNNKLELSTEVYSLDNIEKACEAYKNHAKIIKQKKHGRIELYFFKCKYDTNITMKEFENYLINAENTRI